MPLCPVRSVGTSRPICTIRIYHQRACCLHRGSHALTQTALALAGDKINDLAGDIFKDVLAIANPSRLAASRIWCLIVGVKRRPATDTSCVAQTGSLVAYANCAAESFNPGRT